MKRTVVLMLALCWLAGSAGTAAADHAHGFHWARSSNPFDVHFIDSTNAEWHDIFLESAADWSKSDVLDIDVTRGATGIQKRLKCPTEVGVVRICNAHYGDTGWFALFSFVTDGPHLVKGVVKINESYFTAINFHNNSKFKRRVVCQKIGQSIGLGHSGERRSCLGPSSHDDPGQHDFEELERIYRHLD